MKAIFIRLTSFPFPRVERSISVAKELGYEIIFCGACRQKGLKRHEHIDGTEIFRIGPFFELLHGKKPMLYIWSIICFQFALIKFFLKNKPDLIHASDIQTMPACVLYSFFFRRNLIYNIHDNLAQRYSNHIFLSGIFNFLEGLFVLFSNHALVPEEFRKNALPRFCQSKVKIVRNTPSNATYEKPKNFLNNSVNLFYGGWLDFGRGIKEMVELTKKIPNSKLTLAGEGSEEVLEYIKNQENIEYLGLINNKDALMLTKDSHFVIGIYNPKNLINRYAASNKVAEALAIGRPIIINKEMEITKIFSESSAAVIAEFGDTDSWAKQIVKFQHDYEEYLKASLSARDVYNEHYKWSEARKTLIKVLS